MTYLHEEQTTFTLSAGAPRAARRWLHATGIVPAELADAVDLVVSELVTNSVTHSGLAAPNVVSVHVASFPGGIAGEVIDTGRGMGDEPSRTAPSMGLRLVDGTVSRWGHTDHPTRVWFELTITHRGSASRRRAA